MRISDWSSDVCSSDRQAASGAARAAAAVFGDRAPPAVHLGPPPAAVRHQPRRRRRGQERFRLRVDQRDDRAGLPHGDPAAQRSEEHTSELQSLMRISYAVFCLKTNKNKRVNTYKIKK